MTRRRIDGWELPDKHRKLAPKKLDRPVRGRGGDKNGSACGLITLAVWSAASAAQPCPGRLG